MKSKYFLSEKRLIFMGGLSGPGDIDRTPQSADLDQSRPKLASFKNPDDGSSYNAETKVFTDADGNETSMGPEAAEERRAANAEDMSGAPEAKEAAKSPEELKQSLTERATKMRDTLTAILEDRDKYPEGFVRDLEALEGELMNILQNLEALKDTNSDGNFLSGLDSTLKGMEDSADVSNDNLKAQAEAKEKLDEAKQKLNEADRALSPEKVKEAVATRLGEGNAELIEKLAGSISEKVNEMLAPKIVEWSVAIEETGELIDPAKITEDAQKAIDELSELNIDKIMEGFKDKIDPANKVVAAVKRLEGIGGDGKHCTAAKKEMITAIIDGISDKDENVSSPEALMKEAKAYEEAILMGHVADVVKDVTYTDEAGKEHTVEMTPEKIKNAIRLYDLGEYKTTDEGEAKAILNKLADLKIPGVKIDFMGGTDATEHKLKRSKTYHKNKAAAFATLRAFHPAKLNINLTEEQLAKIEAYETAANAGKGYEHLKGLPDAERREFLDGGGLFDMALATQRAEDMQKRIHGENATLDPATQNGLYIELGGTPKTREERKSGLKFSAVEAQVAPPAEEAPPADGTPAEAPPADGTPAEEAPPADGTPAEAPPADGTP
ncbi:MAG: hypothetical protein O3B47_00475, partial [bacterium]|nr:hypothetical protein [bacterium]